ncbi:MAG: hypothetical protein ACK45B_07005 [Limisphaerales bacterium]|jgi:hypothetical protein
MSEPTPSPPKSNAAFRIWGHVLLWFGFLWLTASRVLFDPGVLAKTSRHTSDGFPRKESYSWDEVFGIIETFSRQIRDDPPWIFTPAVLMLAGGLLLARASARR